MAHENRTCRWAALSLSSIASVFVPDILLPREASASIKHELVAVSTTGSKDRAVSWLKENKVPKLDTVNIYLDWNEMLEKADFDAVYISTPHPLHYQHVKKALECGRNVLVEKPATMNASQYERLATVAHQQKVVLAEAMWTRYLPATRYLQEEILPRIGDVKRVYSEFSFPIVSPDLPDISRFLDKEAGAGSLLDQGVYALTWVDLALNGIDKSAVTKVAHANSMSVLERSGDIDDIDTVILSQQDESSKKQQAVAIVTTSMTLPGSNKPSFYQRLQAKKSAPAVRIEATKASIAIPFPPIRPQELHVQWYDEDHVDANGIEKDEIIEMPVERGWGLWYQADVVAQKVASKKTGGEGEVVGVDGSLRVLRWMDEARQLAGISYSAEIEKV